MMITIPKGTKLNCEHCGKFLNKITKDLPDSTPIRHTDDYLKIKVGVPGQKIGAIRQVCKACGEESDLYRLILEVLHKGS